MVINSIEMRFSRNIFEVVTKHAARVLSDLKSLAFAARDCKNTAACLLNIISVPLSTNLSTAKHARKATAITTAFFYEWRQLLEPLKINEKCNTSHSRTQNSCE